MYEDDNGMPGAETYSRVMAGGLFSGWNEYSLSSEGLSASGDLKIEMNGDYKVTHISIDESLISDREMLEDLIMIAVNDASSKINEISKKKMKNVTGGLNLPF